MSLKLSSEIIYCLLGSDSFSSLFHSTGAATAKPRISMCILGQVEETGSLLPQVRLLELIEADRYRGWEKLISLKTRRLYLKRIWC